MRFAVPLFGDQVAPRFCSADELLVVDVEGGRENARSVQRLAGMDLPGRIAALARMGVERLYCGGFNARFLPLAEGLGLRVCWGLVGQAEEAVQDVLSGREPRAVLCGCGRGRASRGRGRNGPGRGLESRRM